MTFKDYFSRQSPKYAQYRPRYPHELFAYLATLCPKRDRAWDCATGSGQAALALTPWFEQVVATDGSATQIAQAPAHPQIDYRVALADDSGLGDRSADLVTVAQAAHWFPLEAFYREVRRVVKPNGIVAIWCYELMAISDAVDPLIDYFYRTVVDSYWPPEQAIVADHYRSIEFPFAELTPPTFHIQMSWSLDQLCGYLSTWSASHNYQDVTGSSPLDVIGDRLLTAWGDRQTTRTIRWPIHLRVGRVEH